MIKYTYNHHELLALKHLFVGHAYLLCGEELSYFSCTFFIIINMPFVSGKKCIYTLEDCFLGLFPIK